MTPAGEPERPLRYLDLDAVAVIACGLAFVAVSFLPWYDARNAVVEIRYRAWDLGVLAVLAVLLAAYGAGRALLLTGKPPRPNVPVTPEAETFVAVAVALAFTVYRLLDTPTAEAQRTPWLALASLLVLLQAVFALRALARAGVRAR
ncbi:MAG TPA: hypothetical protein VFQ85_15860 [Mycobacteriales bacterium]|nr:hypothetical protein [Mycobacteriales bacterium]